MVTVPRFYQNGNDDSNSSISSVPAGIPIPRNVTELFLFVAPFVMFVSVNLIGVLFATDLLLLAVFPFALVSGLGRLRKPQIWIPLLLCFLWLLSQIVTDVVVDSSPNDYLRVWSKIFLTFTNLATLWILIGESLRRFLIYGLGVTLGSIVQLIVAPNDAFADQPWKFGFAIPVTVLLLILASLLRKSSHRWVFPVTLLSLALIDLLNGARALALIAVAVGAYSYFQMKRFASGKRPGISQTVGLGLMMALAVFGFVHFYRYSAESGLLGEKGRQKYSEQSSGSGGLLLGGRGETLVSVQAIMDSPILGHGSWARDGKYQKMLIQKRLESGTKNVRGDQSGSDTLIPTHSFVMGAWVEAGAIGAIFWLYIFWQVVRALKRATGGEPFLPLFAFIGILMMWDIPFSPYGADRRFTVTYYFIGMIMLGNMADKLRQRRLPGLV